MTADRQTVTVELAADEVLVALKRGEEYEDVHPELVSEDAIGDRWPEYRTIHPASQAPAETPEKTPTGYNRPPNGEPAHPEDWNAGYEAGFADGHEAGAHADKLPIAWMYEHDGSLDEPILTVDRWPECSEPWNETPLDALALAKHAIEKVWLDAVGTGHGEHSISEVARKRVEFAADALKLGLRLPGALRKTGVETPVSQAQPKGRDCPHCNYTGTAHCGDVANQIKANGGNPADCSNAKVYGLRAQAPAPAPEPLTWLKFRAVQRIMGAQGGDVDCHEWLEECRPGEMGDDGKPAFPVYAQAPAVRDEPQDIGGHIRAAASARVAQQADDDTRRLDYLQQRGATVHLIPSGHDSNGQMLHSFCIGGLHRAVSKDIREAIDAAISLVPVQGSAHG